jgi:hypothetical protein
VLLLLLLSIGVFTVHADSTGSSNSTQVSAICSLCLNLPSVCHHLLDWPPALGHQMGSCHHWLWLSRGCT